MMMWRRFTAAAVATMVVAVALPLLATQAAAETVPPNDDRANAIDLVLPAEVEGDTSSATTEADEPSYDCALDGESSHNVWYRFRVDELSRVNLVLTTDHDQGIGLYEEVEPGTLELRDCVDDSYYGEELDAEAKPARTYYVSISPWRPSDRGPFSLRAEARPMVPPGNDAYASALAFEPHGVKIDGTTLDATQEAGEAAPQCASSWEGVRSVWYRFTPTEDGVLRIGFAEYSLVATVSTGATVETRQEFACGGPESPVLARVRAGVEYVVGFASSTYWEGSSFSWTPDLLPTPANDAFEGALGIAVGQTIAGSTEAASVEEGEPALGCGRRAVGSLWYRVDVPAGAAVSVDLTGERSETYATVFEGATLDGLRPITCADYSGGTRVTLDAGSYYVSVAATRYRGEYSLSVSPLRPPAHDAVEGAITLHSGESRNDPAAQATVGLADPKPSCASHRRPTVWYRFVSPSGSAGDGALDVTAHGGGWGYIATAYAVTGSGMVELACWSAPTTPPRFTTTPDTTYLFAVQPYWSLELANAGVTAHYGTSPVNDDLMGASPHTTAAPSAGTIAHATREPGEPQCAAGPSVWHTFTPERDGVLTATLTSSANLSLGVYAGREMGSFGDVDCSDEGVLVAAPTGDVEVEDVSVPVAAGREYRIQVGAAAAADRRAATYELRSSLVAGTRPDNDDVDAARPLPFGQPVDGDVHGATIEPAERSHACPALVDTDGRAPGSVWYRFTAPSSGVSRLRVASDKNIGFTLYRGATPSDLTVVRCRDRRAPTLDEVADFAVTAGETFYLAVEERRPSGGTIDAPEESFTVSLTALPVPANDAFSGARPLDLGPLPVTIEGDTGRSSTEPGEPPHACALATGAYHHSVWYRITPENDGRLLARLEAEGDLAMVLYRGSSLGELGRVTCLDVPIVEHEVLDEPLAGGAEYYLAVLAGDDDATARFELDAALAPLEGPANDDFEDATPMPHGSDVVVNLIGATRQLGEPTSCTGSGASVWFTTVAPPQGGVARFDLDRTAVGAVVYTGTALPELRSHDCFPAQLVDSGQLETFVMEPGETYFVAFVSLHPDLPGDVVVPLHFEAYPHPANDKFASAAPLTAGQVVEGDTRGATSEPGEDGHCDWYGEGTVWYSYRPTSDGVARLRLDSATDQGLAVYTGDAVSTVDVVDCGFDEDSLAEGARTDLPMTAGTTYRIAVASADRADDGPFSLRLDFTPAPGNDDIGAAHALPAGSGVVSTAVVDGALAGATTEAGERRCTSSAAQEGSSVWFSYRPSTFGVASVSVTSTDGVTVAVYRRLRTATGAFQGLEEIECVPPSQVEVRLLTEELDTGSASPGPTALAMDPAYDYYLSLTADLRFEGGDFTLSSTFSPLVPGPQVAVGDTSSAEAAGALSFAIRLSQPVVSSSSVSYRAEAGSASPGTDFTAVSGSVVFEPGEQEKVVSVPVADDTTDEVDQTVLLRLVQADHPIAVADAVGVGTVIDDDAGPAVSLVGDPVVDERAEGALFVTLAEPSEKRVTVSLASIDGTATAGSDFIALSEEVVFEPGATVGSVRLRTIDDLVHEALESFLVRVVGGTDVTFADRDSAVSIRDDDPAPALSVADVAVAEGASGTVELAFTVRLSASTSRTVSVSYATSDGTAMAGSDYEAATGTLTFQPGDREKVVRVAVIGDSLVEPDEVFTLALHDADADLFDASATGTITNDDPVSKGKKPKR